MLGRDPGKYRSWDDAVDLGRVLGDASRLNRVQCKVIEVSKFSVLPDALTPAGLAARL